MKKLEKQSQTILTVLGLITLIFYFGYCFFSTKDLQNDFFLTFFGSFLEAIVFGFLFWFLSEKINDKREKDNFEKAVLDGLKKEIRFNFHKSFVLFEVILANIENKDYTFNPKLGSNRTDFYSLIHSSDKYLSLAREHITFDLAKVYINFDAISSLLNDIFAISVKVQEIKCLRGLAIKQTDDLAETLRMHYRTYLLKTKSLAEKFDQVREFIGSSEWIWCKDEGCGFIEENIEKAKEFDIKDYNEENA